MVIKGSAMGCVWTGIVIVGMFIVLGILSFLFVRFILPDDMLEDMTDPAITETTEDNDNNEDNSDLTFILNDRPGI